MFHSAPIAKATRRCIIHLHVSRSRIEQTNREGAEFAAAAAAREGGACEGEAQIGCGAEVFAGSAAGDEQNAR